jgi:nicotinamidase-related amidase
MNHTLLVIDAQNDYFPPDGKLVLPDAEGALSNILLLIDAARASGHPVIHVRHERLEADAPVFRSGSDGVRIHPSIAVDPGERIVLKHVPGAFTETPLERYLRFERTERIVVCGYMTQQCCEMTTRQAFERGIPVLFASDATAARPLTLHGKTYSQRAVHEASLAAVGQYASVATTGEIVAQLRSTRGVRG